MEEYISVIENELGYEVNNPTDPQSRSSNITISFTDRNGNRKVAKIQDKYEYVVSTNIPLEYVDTVPYDQKYEISEKLCTVEPYVESELVDWSDDTVVRNFIQEIADLMYSFHRLDKESLDDFLGDLKLRDKTSNLFTSTLESSKDMLENANELSEFENILENMFSEVEKQSCKVEDLGVIHGDVYIPNMIQSSNGDIRYVIDLESTAYGYKTYDVGKMFSCILRLYSPLTSYSTDELFNMYFNMYKGHFSEDQKERIRLFESIYTIRAYGRVKGRNKMYKPWSLYESTGDGIKRYKDMAENVHIWFKSKYN